MSKDVEDAFADFENKVSDKPKKKFGLLKKDQPSSDLSEEDLIKQKYQEEKDVLKEKFRKEMASIHAKKTKKAIKEGKLPLHHQFKIERFFYIAVIAILVLYVLVDLSFFHGSTQVIEQTSETQAQATGSSDTDESNTESTKEESEEETKDSDSKKDSGGDTAEKSKEESKKEEKEAETKEEEKKETEKKTTKKRSGRVDFIINKIDTELVDDDLGYIKRVTFTIQNDKDTTLTPLVNVYAYDDELEDTWIARSRGTYTLPAGISPGKYEEGEILLSPKTFRNLNLEKTVRIELNDTKEGFIKATSKDFTIE